MTVATNLENFNKYAKIAINYKIAIYWISPMGKATPSEPYFTPTQVAEMFKVAPVTVRSWALNGRINFFNTPGGHRRFTKSSIEDFARKTGVELPNTKGEMRVLIVDDDLEYATFLANILREYRVLVDVARSGFEAGESVQTFKPTVILLDLIMPGLNGFETCEKLKSSERTQHIKIIGITGFDHKDYVEHIVTLGADTCLIKPILSSTLLETLGITEETQKK